MKKLITYTYQGKQYPVIMVTADAVVFAWDKMGKLNILLVRRKDNGKLALPGGYVHYDEDFSLTATRECIEETGFNPAMQERIGFDFYTSPTRCKQGNRKITAAYVYRCGFGLEYRTLPKVKASDDARSAGWKRFEKLRKSEMHDDHYSIIDHSIKYL
jgi:8-oxo-dGTP diphosphatase